MRRKANSLFDRVGLGWGEFLLQTVRGFEFATGLGSLNNALFVLQTDSRGAPVAAFLHGSGGLLARPALMWSTVFATLGLVVLALFCLSMKGGGFVLYARQRAIASSLLGTLYAVVSLQVLRSGESPFLAGRYVLTLVLTLCVTVLLVRLIWNERARSRLATRGGT